jgi:hypothetical protein
MLNGFEDITYNLTETEKKLVDGFVKSFEKRIGKKNAITSTRIIQAYKDIGINMTGPRIRKIINYIRINGLVKNLIATSEGYYIETDPEKIKEYKESLLQRCREIKRIADTY